LSAALLQIAIDANRVVAVACATSGIRPFSNRLNMMNQAANGREVRDMTKADRMRHYINAYPARVCQAAGCFHQT
jgi:hypothetical protein